MRDRSARSATFSTSDTSGGTGQHARRSRQTGRHAAGTTLPTTPFARLHPPTCHCAPGPRS